MLENLSDCPLGEPVYTRYDLTDASDNADKVSESSEPRRGKDDSTSELQRRRRIGVRAFSVTA